jgi:hypothetical protein
MIFEWRIYEIAPGKGKELHERFTKHVMKLWEKHDIKLIGFWECRNGGTTNTLYHMLAFEDMGHLEKAWRSFRADPEWQRVQEESEKNGPLVSRMTSVLLEPTSYSPIR